MKEAREKKINYFQRRNNKWKLCSQWKMKIKMF